jgi:hypothetical protein
MEKGFFFYRVDRFCTHLSKGGCVQCPVPVEPDATDAVLTLLYVTPVAAEKTVNLQAFSFPVQPRLVPVIHQEENNRAYQDKSAGCTKNPR